MDEEDFLAAVEADNTGAPVAEEPKVETPPEPEPPEPEQPAEPAPEPEPPVEAPEPPKPDKTELPLAALLDERDRRKAAEAELARIREAQKAQPVQMPDPYEDPEGYAAAQQAQVSQQLYQTNLRWSERIASIQHGEETVSKAKEWGFQRCEADPYFNAKVASSPDPIGYVVTEFKREQIASQVTPDEFAQFQAWKAAQGQLQQQGGQPPPPNKQAAIPSPSLASAPSAGSILTEPALTDEEVFNAVMPVKR